MEQYLSSLINWANLIRNLSQLQNNSKLNTTDIEAGPCNISNLTMNLGETMANQTSSGPNYCEPTNTSPNSVQFGFQKVQQPNLEMQSNANGMPLFFPSTNQPTSFNKQNNLLIDIASLLKYLSNFNQGSFSDILKDNVYSDWWNKCLTGNELNKQIEHSQMENQVLDLKSLLLSAALLQPSLCAFEHPCGPELPSQSTQNLALLSILGAGKKQSHYNPYPKPPYSYIALITMVYNYILSVFFLFNSSYK